MITVTGTKFSQGQVVYSLEEHRAGQWEVMDPDVITAVELKNEGRGWRVLYFLKNALFGTFHGPEPTFEKDLFLTREEADAERLKRNNLQG